MSILDGKKTYALALAAILAAIAGYLTGDLTAVQAVEAAWAGGVAATLRHGIGG